MARSKLYDRGRGGDDGETKPGAEPEPATRVRGESEEGEPSGAAPADGHIEEHEALNKAHEDERREMHGRHRNEHREMNKRHIAEHEDGGEGGELHKLHRKQEHEHRAMRHKHLHEHTEMLHRHLTAIHDLHQRSEMGAGEEEKKPEPERRRA